MAISCMLDRMNDAASLKLDHLGISKCNLTTACSSKDTVLQVRERETKVTWFVIRSLSYEATYLIELIYSYSSTRQFDFANLMPFFI